MKAIVQHRYGGPETLEVAEIEPPSVGRGDVRVRVRAAAVDAGVRHLMSGEPWLIRPVMGFSGPRQRVPGIDAAGTSPTCGPEIRWTAGCGAPTPRCARRNARAGCASPTGSRSRPRPRCRPR